MVTLWLSGPSKDAPVICSLIAAVKRNEIVQIYRTFKFGAQLHVHQKVPLEQSAISNSAFMHIVCILFGSQA